MTSSSDIFFCLQSPNIPIYFFFLQRKGETSRCMCYWTYWINLVLLIQITDVADPSLHLPQKVLIWHLYGLRLLKQTHNTYVAVTFTAVFILCIFWVGHSCLEQIRRLILKYWKNNARCYWRQ